MRFIKKFNSFVNEKYEHDVNKNIKIIVAFNYDDVDYNFILDLNEEGEAENYGKGADFWTSFYGKDKNNNDISFDVHYSEDYNSITIYPIDMDTLETDYSITIHSQPIFLENEYERIQKELEEKRKDEDLRLDEDDDEYRDFNN